MSIRIIEANLDNETHADHVLYLTNAYSMDPMGDGKPLSDDIQDNLIEGLKAMPTTLIFLAMDGSKPVGIATCFVGFSTFNARKLINIHDIGVLPSARGKGVGSQLIDAVSNKAIEMDCCKVTLEVLQNNAARRLYEREGFEYGDPFYYFMNKYLD